MELPFPFPREMLSIWYPLSLGMLHMTSHTNMQMVVWVTTTRGDVIARTSWSHSWGPSLPYVFIRISNKIVTEEGGCKAAIVRNTRPWIPPCTWHVSRCPCMLSPSLSVCNWRSYFTFEKPFACFTVVCICRIHSFFFFFIKFKQIIAPLDFTVTLGYCRRGS